MGTLKKPVDVMVCLGKHPECCKYLALTASSEFAIEREPKSSRCWSTDRLSKTGLRGSANAVLALLTALVAYAVLTSPRFLARYNVRGETPDRVTYRRCPFLKGA
jgi:hypothetical protein